LQTLNNLSPLPRNNIHISSNCPPKPKDIAKQQNDLEDLHYLNESNALVDMVEYDINVLSWNIALFN